MTSSDLPNQPHLLRTPAAVAASPENLVPPHNGNQTLGGIILCLPAQRKNSAETIATTMPSKNLTSTSQRLDSNANRDAMTSRDLPNQSLSRTLAAAAASPENLVPPHNQNQTLGGIILCLPAQRKNSRTAPASSGIDARVKKVDDALHQNTITLVAASSIGVEGKQAMKKRRFGTKSPLTNPHFTGNTGVPSQSNLPRKPKELPRNDIHRMLMDKARTEILGYLND